MIEPLEARVFLSSAPRRSAFGDAVQLPGVVQVENYDRGGEGITYHDLTAGNAGKAYRTKDGVDIYATGETPANYAIAWTQNGEWLEYTVNVAHTTAFNITFRAGSIAAGGRFHLNLDGRRATQVLNVPLTAGPSGWELVSGGSVVLAKGRHVLRLVMDTAGGTGKSRQVGRFDWFSLKPQPPRPASDLVATAQSTSAIALGWKGNSPLETGFVIERSSAADGPWQSLAGVAATPTSYIDSGLPQGTQYYYRVTAVNGGFVSLPSNAAAATTQSPASPPQNTGTNGGANTVPVITDIPTITDATQFSSPIIIRHGGTYTGNWESQDPDTPAVFIDTSDPVIITNSIIRSAGNLIETDTGIDADVTVRNSSGYGITPFLADRHAGRFLAVDRFTNVTVENDYLQGTSGIYLSQYTGDHSAGQTVRVNRNIVRNIDGRLRDGNGGFSNDPNGDNYAQFVQVALAPDLAGAEISWNEVINNPGQSQVEDVISIYSSSGTAQSPLLIHDNYIQGAYSANPAIDTEYSGGGIMLSDNGSSFVQAYDNQVLDTTNYGIAISSGHDNVFYNNRILSSGTLADGTSIPTQNVGAYIWNAHGEAGFANNSGHDNLIGWMLQSDRNDSFTPDAADWSNNSPWPRSDVTRAAIANEWNIWQQKLAAAAGGAAG